MKRVTRLDVRLFLSYAVVVVVGAVTLLVTTRVLAPSLFNHQIGMMRRDGAMSMSPGFESQTHHAFGSALDRALAVAVIVSVVGAGAVSVFVARRILRPLDAVRDATRRLADGRYDERITLPREAELAALAVDVNSLAESLETTERRRAQLIGDVAHELRTPLTTIDGYMEGLVDGVFEPTDEIFVAVSEEVSRLERLAADLSALSKAEEGALDLHLEPADLGEIAMRVAERLRPQYRDQDVALVVQPGPPLLVRIDPDRMTQVFTNLLGNAVAYTPVGGRVVVERGVEHGSAWVSVSDTGRGLDPADVARVFERFFRVPGVTKPPGGSGIGLTIARSISRAHGGDVSAESPGPEKGSTFTVRVPIDGDMQSPTPAA